MTQFWVETTGFIVYVFTAFALFAVAWLHWDVQKLRTNRLTQAKFTGLLILATAMLVRIFALGNNDIAFIVFLLLTIGASLLAWAVRTEPILPSSLKEVLPTTKKEDHHPKHAKHVHAVLPIWVLALPILPGLISLYTAIQLRQHYQQGHMREYRWLVPAFAAFGAAIVLMGMEYFGNSTVILLQQLFGPLSLFWIVEHILFAVAALCMGKWFWTYVQFRVHPELFVTVASIAIALSTLSALTYALLLFNNAERDLLSQLRQDVEVVDLAVDNLEANALTAATLLGKQDSIIRAYETNDYQALLKTAQLYAQETAAIDSIVFTDNAAQILVNTADLSRVGQSLSEDNLVLYALKEKQRRVSVTTVPGVLGDDVIIKAVQPVIGREDVLGVVQTQILIDDAFVDNVKRQTGAEVAVYSGDRRAATTILGANGLQRRENSVDTNQAAVDTVLKNSQSYTGRVLVVNEPYHGAYAPLTDTNAQTIGMLFVGRPQSILMHAVHSSILTTFFVSVAASMLALIPAYAVAKRIERGGV